MKHFRCKAAVGRASTIIVLLACTLLGGWLTLVSDVLSAIHAVGATLRAVFAGGDVTLLV